MRVSVVKRRLAHLGGVIFGGRGRGRSVKSGSQITQLSLEGPQVLSAHRSRLGMRFNNLRFIIGRGIVGRRMRAVALRRSRLH